MKMSKRKIFVSFDFENDRNYKYLLEAWNGNSKFEFEFDDKSTREINSWNIPTIKAALTKKINQADYTIVIVGKEANKKHTLFNYGETITLIEVILIGINLIIQIF